MPHALNDLLRQTWRKIQMHSNAYEKHAECISHASIQLFESEISTSAATLQGADAQSLRFCLRVHAVHANVVTVSTCFAVLDCIHYVVIFLQRTSSAPSSASSGLAGNDGAKAEKR